jgi:hypothetical protein
MIPDATFTLQLAKDHLRVLHAQEDTLITAQLDAAVERCEQYTGVAATERANMKARVPYGCYSVLLPVVQVKPTTMVVEYMRNDDTLQPYAAGTWAVRSTGSGGQLLMLREIPQDLSPDATEYALLTYTAEPSVPPSAAVVAAALLYLGDLYENREGQIVGTISAPNKSAEALLDPHRITWGL